MKIVYVDIPCATDADIIELLKLNNWPEYKDIHHVTRAIKNSPHLVMAFDVDNNTKLVGMTRTVSDDAWSAYIDCLLVHPDYQNQHIGTQLIKRLIKRIKSELYITVAPNNPETIPFYEKLGFSLLPGTTILQINNKERMLNERRKRK